MDQRQSTSTGLLIEFMGFIYALLAPALRPTRQSLLAVSHAACYYSYLCV